MARKKIVVVENSEELLLMESGLLKKNGYEVYAASNGALAVDYIKKHKPDLVLMNVDLPDINSYSLCKSIKDTDCRDVIPVIMISSANNKLNLDDGERAGVDGYVIVPFRVSMLIGTIEKALAGEL